MSAALAPPFPRFRPVSVVEHRGAVVAAPVADEPSGSLSNGPVPSCADRSPVSSPAWTRSIRSGVTSPVTSKRVDGRPHDRLRVDRQHAHLNVVVPPRGRLGRLPAP